MTHTEVERPGLFRSVSRFFHGEEVPYGTALIRIVLPWALLGALLRRWPYARELYSTDGAATPIWNSYGFPGMLPEPSGMMAVILMTALIFFLVTSSLGWRTRLSLAISFVLYTYFNMLDAVSTITKYSCIASHVLLVLSVSHCGSVWSVDSWLQRRREARMSWPGEPAVQWKRSPAWTRRMIQLVIAIVYFGAAITKMHTPEFFTGEQLMAWMITHVNFDHTFGEYLAMHPIALIVSGYITILWELLFLFLCWNGWGRRTMLTLGAAFHLMTTVTLGLYVFPAICLSLYFAFLNEDDVRYFAQVWRRAKRRWSWLRDSSSLTVERPLPAYTRVLSPVVFGVTALVVIGGAVGVEHRLDPYGIRRAEGRHTLVELDPRYVEKLLSRAEPIRDVDKFFSLDVGTIQIGGVVVDRRQHFTHGDVLVAQVVISPPHEDMWVECNLHDANDRTIDKSPLVVTREMLKGTFRYKLSEALRPGDYYLVLKKAGKEITRRKIVLHSGDETVTAAVAN